MKKILLLSLMLVSATTFAQFYASLGAGYSMGMPYGNGVLGLDEGSNSTVNYEFHENNIYGTYGTGVNGKLNLGYFLNDNLGVELGFTYLMGSEQLIGIYEYVSINSETKITTKAKATSIGLAPTLFYKLDNGLYGKFGFATKIGGKVAERSEQVNGIYITKRTLESKGKMPLGFTGAMGYEFEVGNNLNLFIEMEYLDVSIKKDKSTLTAYEETENGVVIRTFEDEGCHCSNYTDETSWWRSYNLTETRPYSSFGFNIGIRYTIGNIHIEVPKKKE